MDMLTTAHTPRRAVDAARGSPPTAYRLRVQCTILGELTTSTSLCTFKYWYSGVRMTVLLKFELTMYTPTQHRLHKYKRVPSKYSESPCTAGASAPNDAHLRRKCARSPVTPRDLQYSASPWICISPDGTHPSVYHRRTRRVLRVLMEHVCPRRTYTCVPSETLDSHCTASPGITLECTPTTHTQKCAVDTVVLHCECEYRALCVSSDSIKQRRQRGYDPTRAVWCESRDSDGSGGPSISSDGIHICVQHVFAVEDSAPTVQCEFGDGHGYDGVGVQHCRRSPRVSSDGMPLRVQSGHVVGDSAPALYCECRDGDAHDGTQICLNCQRTPHIPFDSVPLRRPRTVDAFLLYCVCVVLQCKCGVLTFDVLHGAISRQRKDRVTG
ncbi:hypothetical protein DFP72DRAFT_862059 [Ephemerocybe angulata]|uniref:Uncharacterized protein n=1 Tax=Ephemerocybe angulata TaxID=980116 RepID=A0A8H6H6V4_9AGAR|nr:hypothetical protein DFP72DRAFT_862059 [Tulosesus angulatus]